jgi:hypothetical protein
MGLNYSALLAAVQNYTENTESSFVSLIPTFVQLAEERIYNSVQINSLRKNQLGSFTINNKYLTLPTDWLSTYSLAVIDPVTNAQTYLLQKDPEFIRESFPDPDTTGVPLYYGQFDVETLIVGPTPNASYGAEIHYYYYPESIVTAGTTWLGNNFSDVLLYGTLREAYLYMKGEQDLITMYESKYNEGLQLLRSLSEGINRRDAYRIGMSRGAPLP